MWRKMHKKQPSSNIHIKHEYTLFLAATGDTDKK